MPRLGCALLLLAASCGAHRYAGLEPELVPPTGPSEVPRADARAWYLRARVAASLGDQEEAARAWRWALRLHPSDAWIHAAHGEWLSDQGRVSEARSAFLAALERAPHSALILEASGLFFLEQGDPSEAVRLLGAAVETTEGSASWRAWEGLVRACVDTGDEEAARTHLSAWLQRLPSSTEEAWARAQEAITLDEPGLAVDPLLHVLDAGAPPPGLVEELVVVARRSCRVGTALEWAWDEHAWLRGGDAWHRGIAELALAAGDPDLLALATPGEHLLERARLLARQGRAEEGLAVLREARTAPPSAEVLLEEAALLRQLGRLEPALASLERVPLDDPLGPRALALQVEVLLEQGRTALALRRARSGLATHPEEAQLRWALALALQASGAVEEAEATVDPGRPLARLRLERGDTEGALRALRDAAVEDPRSPAELARLLERAGHPHEAHQAWLQALARDRDDPSAWLGVARTDPEQATGALREALRVDPCYVPALLESARRASGDTELDLLERAVDASPLDIRALDALAHAAEVRGLDSRARTLRRRALRLTSPQEEQP